MKKFTPIAMRCTKKEFESVRPRLKKAGREIRHISSFESEQYLVNDFNWKNEISNISSKVNEKVVKHYEWHETWDEKIFLEACGIETEPKFEITKEQIMELSKDAHPSVVGQLKEWFPDVFETVLEVGKWYKRVFFENTIVFCKEITKDGFKGYGFCQGYWDGDYCAQSKYSEVVEATTEEVTEALINEAKKRGLKDGVFFKECKRQNGNYGSKGKCSSYISYNKYEDGEEVLISGGIALFCNGIWAEIIQTKKMTQAEIEKELGYKIEIV